METNNVLFITVGLPRSGKSTWARLKSKEIKCPIVSADAIRRVLYERRFWMPGDKLVRLHAWVMVRALFVAGHQQVILDETNLSCSDLSSWRCMRKNTTPIAGGEDYPPLLAVDQNKMLSAEELQGDVIAWKRHIVVFRTAWKDCVQRANDPELDDYNQRETLVGFIRSLKEWDPRFVEQCELDDDEDFEYLDQNLPGPA